MASKALNVVTDAAEAVRRASRIGVNAGPPTIDFDNVHDVIAAIAPITSIERFEGFGVTVINQAVRFSKPRTIWLRLTGPTHCRRRQFQL